MIATRSRCHAGPDGNVAAWKEKEQHTLPIICHLSHFSHLKSLVYSPGECHVAPWHFAGGKHVRAPVIHASCCHVVAGRSSNFPLSPRPGEP